MASEQPPASAPAKPSRLARLRAAASDLLQRAQLAAAAGITFGGKRDLFRAFGYKQELTMADYRARFLRNGVARRVVTTWPKATWRGGADLVEDDDPDTITPFEEAFAAFAKRVKLWPTFSRADTLAGLGRYSVILIGAPGKLEEELPKGTSLDEIAYLQPYAEDEAKIAETETNETSERFGLPRFYSISRISVSPDGSKRKGGSASAMRVHWTRCLHIADDLTDDNVFGTPKLEAIWNDIDNLEKVAGAGAEAFWLRAHPGYNLNLDKDVEMGAEDEEALQDEIDEFEHGFRRFVRTRGLDWKTLDAEVADFSKPVDACLTLISAATGIPKRILMGSERGELASNQDKNNFDQRVGDRRLEFAEPVCVWQLLDRLQAYGYIDENQDRHVVWPQQQDLNQQERADLAGKWALVNRQMGDVVVTPDEIRDKVLGLPKLSDAVDEDELARLREVIAGGKNRAIELPPEDQGAKPKPPSRPPQGDPEASDEGAAD